MKRSISVFFIAGQIVCLFPLHAISICHETLREKVAHVASSTGRSIANNSPYALRVLLRRSTEKHEQKWKGLWTKSTNDKNWKEHPYAKTFGLILDFPQYTVFRPLSRKLFNGDTHDFSPINGVMHYATRNWFKGNEKHEGPYELNFPTYLAAVILGSSAIPGINYSDPIGWLSIGIESANESIAEKEKGLDDEAYLFNDPRFDDILGELENGNINLSTALRRVSERKLQLQTLALQIMASATEENEKPNKEAAHFDKLSKLFTYDEKTFESELKSLNEKKELNDSDNRVLDYLTLLEEPYFSEIALFTQENWDQKEGVPQEWIPGSKKFIDKRNPEGLKFLTSLINDRVLELQYYDAIKAILHEEKIESLHPSIQKVATQLKNDPFYKEVDARLAGSDKAQASKVRSAYLLAWMYQKFNLERSNKLKRYGVISGDVENINTVEKEMLTALSSDIATFKVAGNKGILEKWESRYAALKDNKAKERAKGHKKSAAAEMTVGAVPLALKTIQSKRLSSHFSETLKKLNNLKYEIKKIELKIVQKSGALADNQAALKKLYAQVDEIFNAKSVLGKSLAQAAESRGLKGAQVLKGYESAAFVNELRGLKGQYIKSANKADRFSRVIALGLGTYLLVDSSLRLWIVDKNREPTLLPALDLAALSYFEVTRGK